jgi:hypothetical protein
MHLPELDWYCFNIDGSLTSEAPIFNLLRHDEPRLDADIDARPRWFGATKF